MKKISRFAYGLNKLFDAVGVEATPQWLEEHVQATVDATQFYGLTNIRDQTSAANGGIGTSALLSVPTDPPVQWLLLHVSGQFTTQAALTFAGFALNIDGVPVDGYRFKNTALQVDWTGSPRQVYFGFQLPYPRMLKSGRTINLTLSDLAGVAALDFQVNASFGLIG